MYIPLENNCTYTSCEKLDKNKCQSFNTRNWDEELCVNLGSGCELVECGNLKSNQCSLFPTGKLSYKCISKGEGCELKEKECSELPVEFCKEKEYERDDEQICVLNDKKDKCTVKGASQQIHIGFLTISIFSLLF